MPMPAGVNDEQAIAPVPVESAPAPGEPLLAPRPSVRTATRTSAAFGAVEVGPPVSRLVARPEPGAPAGVPPVPGTPPAARPARCPSCAARVRPEQDWCSLCHASLLPAEPAPAVPVPAPREASAAPVARVTEDDDGQLALDFAAPRPPAVDEAEVARMLGALARSDRPAPRGLGSRQAKVAVAVGGGLGLTALLLGAMTAIGAVLG
ncbi:hypothetical protein [Kineococcus radiotolerans]|uniref:Zinc ribbon domain-containing protein n=1 Tax=Kineococcus radiotolerans (strain ATCC BAA-149 / DSM 14245 / SRS30216) TaxID=266940 RepID=A6WD15_KINRD|nr:hypothetical protein [Kineococcus radiotolerans]ABS04704.1 hypothetical protein Krad_3240 [Kineococcus radiotolerans SRS30216 = ATCC BAA-149]